ncbi:hypothetical protein LJR230_001735 [Trinickia sp. LjRoot230]
MRIVATARKAGFGVIDPPDGGRRAHLLAPAVDERPPQLLRHGTGARVGGRSLHDQAINRRGKTDGEFGQHLAAERIADENRRLETTGPHPQI